jgi:hypothetical protein|tara:strand:- start:2148 stop:2828 length:681 start_codon:yes stop_codon:yes gene_type:complete
MIIGLVGLKGCGKDTVADYFISHYDNWIKGSFADSLKDTCACVFGWDRELLEGSTQDSRAWRETTDTWWSEKLNRPNFTPRIALQIVGTDLWRNQFNDDIWLLSFEKKLLNIKENVIITDCRFPNEIDLIKQIGGIIVRVKRGEDPEWWNTAVADNAERVNPMHELMMPTVYPEVHSSEHSWPGCNVDYIIYNDGTFEDLENTIKNLELDPLAAKVFQDLILIQNN